LKDDFHKAASYLKQHNIELMENIKFQMDNYNEETGSWARDTFLKMGCTIGWYFALIPAKTDLSICCHLRTVDYLNQKT